MEKHARILEGAVPKTHQHVWWIATEKFSNIQYVDKDHFTRSNKFSSMQQLSNKTRAISRKKRKERRMKRKGRNQELAEKTLFHPKRVKRAIWAKLPSSTQSISNLKNLQLTQAKDQKSIPKLSWANLISETLLDKKRRKYGIEKQKMRLEYQSFTLSTPKSQISQKPLKKHSSLQLIRIHATSITILR